MAAPGPSRSFMAWYWLPLGVQVRVQILEGRIGPRSKSLGRPHRPLRHGSLAPGPRPAAFGECRVTPCH